MESALAAPACDTSAPNVLLERFVAADCESCWQNASEPATRTMVLDWITPTSDAAPLAAAALPEAGTRAGAAPGNETMLRESRLTRPDAPRVRISDGPAWNGYIGLQLTVHKRGRLIAGAVGYVALVERVSAGSEGSSVARQLVRAVAGPLVLDELASQPVVQHVRAVRVPPGSRADHLASVGWVETAQGTVIAAAQTPMAGCTPRR
jgi:hypothetical protein